MQLLKWKSQGTPHHLVNVQEVNYKKTTGDAPHTEIGLIRKSKGRSINHKRVMLDKGKLLKFNISKIDFEEKSSFRTFLPDKFAL